MPKSLFKRYVIDEIKVDRPWAVVIFQALIAPILMINHAIIYLAGGNRWNLVIVTAFALFSILYGAQFYLKLRSRPNTAMTANS